MIGKRFSHYRIVERIGAGGMGEVYRARDEHLPRDVAIKILPAGTLADDQARKRFRKEAEMLSQLNHPHIATIYDFDTHDDVDFLVMEYVEGTTLAEKLQDSALPMDEVLRIGIEIAEALDEAQHRGIVHRDLKPKNIGLTLKGQVKVLDFGLARVLKPSTDASTTETLTGATGLAGTLPYMAPEQLRGAPADHRSDLYALGICLYEMCTGKRPFEQELASALISDILNLAPPPPRRCNPDLPRALEYVILQSLEKDPGRRYQSAHDLIRDLNRSRTSSLGVARAKRALGRRWPLALASGAFALLAAAAVLNIGGLRDRLLGRTEIGLVESVVALPSEVVAGKDDQFLTDAIPRTLSTYLAQVEGLDTRMPPTSVEFERVGGDLDKIAKAYGVGAFVVSSVTVRSDRLVVNLQLVEARTRRLIWSQEYDGERERFLELVREAAEGLRRAVRPAAAPLRAVASSSEPEILFQRALYHSNRYNNHYDPSDFESAYSAYQQVLRLDPKRADAAAAIGMLHIYKYESGAEEAAADIELWARRALEIDTRNAKAWALLTYWERYVRGDVEAAFIPGLRAGTFGPEDAVCQIGLGIPLEASSLRLSYECMSLASRLDPLYVHPLLGLAESLGPMGRALEGLALVDQGLELERNMARALQDRAILLALLGRDRDALAVLEELASAEIDPEAFGAVRALVLAQTADHEKWWPAVQQALEWDQGDMGGFKIHLITVLARRGEADAAFEILGRKSSAAVEWAYDWLMLSPDLETLRHDIRFGPIASASRSQFERMLAHVNEARVRGEFPEYLEEPLAKLLADLGMSHLR